MIVCSCNVLSDHQLRSTLAKAPQRQRMSQIYDGLGSSAKCGRCAHTIKRIMEEIPNCAIGSVIASANLHTGPQQQELSSASTKKSSPALLQEF
jgi:bacterioferritin-associated ferredoxin